MMYCNLPKIEIWIYFVLWISAVLYSLHNVYLAGSYYNDSGYGAFASGWTVLGGKKDVSDFEWAVWAPYLYSSVPWLCVNFVGAEIFRYFCKELLPLWYLTLSALYVLLQIGALSLVFMLLEPCLMFALLQFHSRAVLYAAGLILLMLHNTDFKFTWLPISYDSQYLLMISTAWIYMRCQSYCLDTLSSGKVNASLTDLITLLGYCLYFPMLFLGPLVLFAEFQSGVTKPFAPWTLQRMKIFVLNILRFLWWALFLEALLHVLYITALQTDLRYMRRLGAWTHYGLGFGMGIVFQLKYVVSYGISSTMAQAEQIHAPRHPKCIGRIHLYSDMWRYFDQGLYCFLLKYVYVPALGGSCSLVRKLLASLACFVFIYVWHRVYLFVLVWSALNYLGVTLETIGRALGSSAVYQHYEVLHSQTRGIVFRMYEYFKTEVASSSCTTCASASNAAKCQECTAAACGKYSMTRTRWQHRNNLSYSKLMVSTPQNVRRLHAVLGTPLLMMSALSNFYFFAGMTVGNHYMMRLLTGSLEENCILFFFCYCLSQVSIEVKNWEQRNEHRGKIE